jgi:hypothetical protein
VLHHRLVMPHEDPLEFDDPAYDAAAAAYYENLAPPGWFYPFVGEVASEAVLLELYMAKVALALTGRDADAREVITSSQRLWGALNDAKGRDGRFDAVLSDFQTARDARDAIVHAVVWWFDADGPYGDYWEHHHPKSNRVTRLSQHEPAEWMTSGLDRIRALTQRAFELSNAISTT